MCVLLMLVGVGGLVSLIYRGLVAGSLFTVAWLIAAVIISRPHRKEWRRQFGWG